MQITFHFPGEPVILDVDLIDNPAIRSWSDHFLVPGYEADAHVETPFLEWNYDGILLQEYLDILNDRVDRLRSLGYVYQLPMPQSPIEVTRDWTNSLHRFFTHTQREVHDLIKPAYLDDESMKSLQTQATSLLQDVNEYVHRVERYLPHVVKELPMNEIYISHEPKFDQIGWWKLIPEWRQYHSKQHADIILGSQILGKTIIKSYLDGDNPNDWDTTGHYSNFGAIQLQLGPTIRQDIYDSDDFRTWLLKWGLDYHTAWFDFPVGNIADRSMIPLLLQKFVDPMTRRNYPRIVVTVGKRK